MNKEQFINKYHDRVVVIPFEYEFLLKRIEETNNWQFLKKKDYAYKLDLRANFKRDVKERVIGDKEFLKDYLEYSYTLNSEIIHLFKGLYKRLMINTIHTLPEAYTHKIDKLLDEFTIYAPIDINKRIWIDEEDINYILVWRNGFEPSERYPIRNWTIMQFSDFFYNLKELLIQESIKNILREMTSSDETTIEWIKANMYKNAILEEVKGTNMMYCRANDDYFLLSSENYVYQIVTKGKSIWIDEKDREKVVKKDLLKWKDQMYQPILSIDREGYFVNEDGTSIVKIKENRIVDLFERTNCSPT